MALGGHHSRAGILAAFASDRAQRGRQQRSFRGASEGKKRKRGSWGRGEFQPWPLRNFTTRKLANPEKDLAVPFSTMVAQRSVEDSPRRNASFARCRSSLG